MPWKVRVEGQDMKGTAALEWRADLTPPTAPPDFTISRSGEFTPEALAALLAIAYSERNAHLARVAVKKTVEQQIEDALNANDPGPGGSD